MEDWLVSSIFLGLNTVFPAPRPVKIVHQSRPFLGDFISRSLAKDLRSFEMKTFHRYSDTHPVKRLIYSEIIFVGGFSFSTLEYFSVDLRMYRPDCDCFTLLRESKLNVPLDH